MTKQKTAPKKYVIYYRVSTKAQGESGLGLDAQKQYLKHYIKGGDIIKAFTEHATAKSYNCKVRPLLCEAIALCKKHGYILAVAKIDRLSRNLKDAVTIYEDLEGRIFSCDIPSTDGRIDKFMLSMFVAFAERERELISLRTRNAMDELKKQRGEWRAGNPNLHIARLKSIVSNRLRKASNENNVRASLLISEYKNTKTLQQIADILKSQKFRTARDKDFTPTQVARLM